MKKIIYTVSFTIMMMFAFISMNGQGVGIQTNAPNPFAILDIVSTTKGFLLPRMTLSQRDSIKKPAAGLVIWCTDCNEMQVYNGYMWTNNSGRAALTKSLPYVRICYHTWMYKNLSVTTYRNGDQIPVVTDPVAWANLTTGAMCWYNNDSATYGATYGAIYNWYAINDARGIAPQGWHLPSIDEWKILSKCNSGDSISGGKLKSTSALWASPNIGAINTSGFYGLPAGKRNANGIFSEITNYGNWWSRNENNSNDAWFYYLSYQNKILSNSTISKNSGFSLRCVRD